MTWQQPVQKKINQQKKVEPKPKIKPEPKPSPKPKPKITPQPVLTEIVRAKKPSPVIEPVKVVNKTIEPSIQNTPTTPIIDKEIKPNSEKLPTPIPIFKLTQLPRMIHRQQPVYPLSMKQQGREATVKLEVLLDLMGKIRNITIKKSAGQAFDQAAINAIRESTFMPAKIKNKPVAVIMKIPVKFRLR